MNFDREFKSEVNFVFGWVRGWGEGIGVSSKHKQVRSKKEK